MPRVFISLLFFMVASLDGVAQGLTESPAQDSPVTEMAVGANRVKEAGQSPVSTHRERLGIFMDGAAMALRRDKQLAGLTLALTGKEHVIALRGYGDKDAASGAPVDPEDTLFRIGSISKTFTWTAAMMLVDRGKLDLDADVNQYLVDLQVEPGFDASVTMNHLMAHRAGFEDTIALFMSPENDPRSLAEALADTQPARVYAPGARTSYSNWGAALAAQVVADVAGVPFEKFLVEEILQPLRMLSTTMVPPDQLAPVMRERLSTGHDYLLGQHEAGNLMNIGPFAPAGAIASSAADMARWMQFHLRGGELEGVRLMSQGTHELMWSRAFGDRAGEPGLAHGFQALSYHGTTLYGHGGSTGKFNALMILAPSLDFGFFASQNSGQAGYATVNTLSRIAIDYLASEQVLPEPDSPVPESTADVELGEFAGDYLNNRRSFTTLTKLFAAQVTLSVGLGPDGGLLVTKNDEMLRYRPVAQEKDLYENRYGARLKFVRDQQGVIVAVNDGSGVHSHEKLDLVSSPKSFLLALFAAGVLAVSTLLGAWRRWGHHPEPSRPGRFAGLVASLNALLVMTLFIIFAIAFAAMSSLSAGNISSFPPVSLKILSYGAWLLPVGAAAGMLALAPAWRESGWGWWRKAHFTLFTLALSALAFYAWEWHVYGAPFF